LPYTGTVSDTTISTSAPDGTYTAIYQLASPAIEAVTTTGNLVLYNGTNYILAPQMALKVSKGRKLEYNDVVDKNFTT